jgi:WD40 repeat protein
MSIALSPDGRIPAAGADDTAVRLYSTETGEMVADLVGHDGSAIAAAFFDDGERLVSGSQDGTAIVWRYVVVPTPKRAVAAR